ncbi:hypothetical protein Scep_006910 [Stephania cephalantha]|uniref:Uncharacterized protein n=1 Tax=Stephania cephalantha TaxID=152367 RepID=A0AAP0K8R5_9MAGN
MGHGTSFSWTILLLQAPLFSEYPVIVDVSKCSSETHIVDNLVKCCKSTCNVTDMKDLLVCYVTGIGNELDYLLYWVPFAVMNTSPGLP